VRVPTKEVSALPEDAADGDGPGDVSDHLGPADRADVIRAGQSDRSRLWRVLSWLRNNKLEAAGITGILAFALTVLLEVPIPRPVHIGLLGVLVAIFPADKPAKKIVSMLWDPSIIYVVDVVAERPDHGGVYRFSSQQFRDAVHVESGSLDWVSPWLAFGRDLEIDDGSPESIERATINGVWRGTLSDRQLMTALSAVQRCRAQLYRDAQVGFEVDAQLWIVVRNAVKDAVETVTETFERGSLPDDGDGVTAAVDDALEDANLARRDDDDQDTPIDDLPGDDAVTLQDLQSRPEVPGDNDD